MTDVSGTWEYIGGPAAEMTEKKASQHIDILQRISGTLRVDEPVQSIEIVVDAHRWRFRRGLPA